PYAVDWPTQYKNPAPDNPGPGWMGANYQCNGVTQPACLADYQLSACHRIRFAYYDKSVLLAAIDSLGAGGSTRINLGLMWGWFTLSPNWQGVWDSSRPELPATITPNVQKVMVLMTDGKNTVYQGNNGISNDDTKTLALCKAIQAQNITLYTIGYGTKDDVNV